MSLAVVISRALDGLDASEVQVEVQLANGLPSFTLVGLADTGDRRLGTVPTPVRRAAAPRLPPLHPRPGRARGC